MEITQSGYHSYLLRLWRIEGEGEHWRASLEDVQSGELYGFADLAALHEYLEILALAEREDKAEAAQPPG